MSDHHGHAHNHSGQKNIKAAFFLNLFFTLVEIAGGLWTNSMAILSDALHDLGDSISLGIAWYLGNYSKKAPDNRFSFGYGRFSLLGALINGIILALGSVIILINAIPRLFSPEKVDPGGMLLIAVFGVVINGIAAFRLNKGSTLNEKTVSWHMIEDVLGWASVLIAAVIMKFIEIPILDTILSILITLFVLYNVAKNLIEVLKIFLQGVPRDISVNSIEQDISEIEGVISVHHTHIWSMEGERNLLSTHIIVPINTSPEEIIRIKKDIRAAMRDKGIGHVTVEMDYEGEGCDSVSCE